MSKRNDAQLKDTIEAAGKKDYSVVKTFNPAQVAFFTSGWGNRKKPEVSFSIRHLTSSLLSVVTQFEKSAVIPLLHSVGALNIAYHKSFLRGLCAESEFSN